MFSDAAILASGVSGITGLVLQLGHVFYFIVLPILLLAATGFVLQRKVGLDMPTLSRLNFYFVIPGMVYVSLLIADISGTQAFTMIAFAMCMIAAMMALTYLVAVIRKVPRDMRGCMLMTTTFHNSGNYGLPLQELAFRSAGLSAAAMSLQTMYLITQNVMNFTLGVLLVAGGRKDRHWRQNLLFIAKFPPLYAVAGALATMQIARWLGQHSPAVAGALEPFWTSVQYIRGAFVAVALCTLGAQLAKISKVPNVYPVKLTVALRLLAAPALAFVLAQAMGMNGLLAQVAIIATGTPTAVNAMLLCMEFDNHPQYAARAVLYATLLSPVTVTLVIFVSQGGFLPQLAIGP